MSDVEDEDGIDGPHDRAWAAAEREDRSLSLHEKIAWRVCDALGVPRYTSIVEIERTVAALRASNARLLEALAILGVEYVSDDEAIGAYWLPVPEGRFVASDAVEAATARRARIVFDGEAEETRATLLAAVERHRKSREACDELTRMWEDEYAPGGGVGRESAEEGTRMKIVCETAGDWFIMVPREESDDELMQRAHTAILSRIRTGIADWPIEPYEVCRVEGGQRNVLGTIEIDHL